MLRHGIAHARDSNVPVRRSTLEERAPLPPNVPRDLVGSRPTTTRPLRVLPKLTHPGKTKARDLSKHGDEAEGVVKVRIQTRGA